MTTDIVDQIVGVTPELDALRRRRPVTREQLRRPSASCSPPSPRASPVTRMPRARSTPTGRWQSTRSAGPS